MEMEPNTFCRLRIHFLFTNTFCSLGLKFWNKALRFFIHVINPNWGLRNFIYRRFINLMLTLQVMIEYHPAYLAIMKQKIHHHSMIF